MIHARELRFGNKVQTQKGEVITVQQILSSSLIYDSQIKVSREAATERGAYKTKYATQVVEMVKESDLHDIHPISLTPKVLEKCGFRNFVRDEWILSAGGSHIDFLFDAQGLRLRHALASQVNLKYLHQLQNFLFSILGYELEPKDL